MRTRQNANIAFPRHILEFCPRFCRLLPRSGREFHAGIWPDSAGIRSPLAPLSACDIALTRRRMELSLPLTLSALVRNSVGMVTRVFECSADSGIHTIIHRDLDDMKNSSDQTEAGATRVLYVPTAKCSIYCCPEAPEFIQLKRHECDELYRHCITDDIPCGIVAEPTPRPSR